MDSLPRPTRSARWTAPSHSTLALWALVLAALTGFDWPGRTARDVSALTAAETPREFRDALRLLRERNAALDAGVLEEALSHPDPGVRADAVAALRRTNVPSDVLQRALADEAAEVRIAAVGVVRAGGGANTGALLELLRDREPRVRGATVRALAPLEGPSVLSGLLAALRDPALDVRIAAVRALALRGEPAALAALLGAFEGALPELKVALLDALAPHVRGRAAFEFELALRDDDEQVVLTALRGFARADDLPRSLLEGLAASPSPAIARAAEQLLARSAERETEPPAWLAPLEWSGRRGLDSAQSEAVLAQLERTLPVGEVLATEPLIEWLRRAPSGLRPRIAALAERAGGAVRADDIAPLLARAEPALRAALIGLLARSEGAATLPFVQHALGDPEPAVRDAAAHVVRTTLDGASAQLLLEVIEDAEGERRARFLALLADGLPRLAPAAPALAKSVCRALEDDVEGEPRSAAAAVRALGALRTRCGRALVRSTMNDRSVGVRIAAIRASVADRGERAKALRSAALRDRDPAIVATAIVARALADDAPPPLLGLDALAREPWPIGPAHAFASAFGASEPERALCPLLDSPEPITRSNALAGLARQPHIACASERAHAWLRQGSSWPLQHAAALWMAARLREDDAASLRGALLRCANAPLAEEVRNVCMGSANTLESPAIAASARALVLGDGRVLVSLPDGAGHVGWPDISVISDAHAWLGAYTKE